MQVTGVASVHTWGSVSGLRPSIISRLSSRLFEGSLDLQVFRTTTSWWYEYLHRSLGSGSYLYSLSSSNARLFVYRIRRTTVTCSQPMLQRIILASEQEL